MSKGKPATPRELLRIALRYCQHAEQALVVLRKPTGECIAQWVGTEDPAVLNKMTYEVIKASNPALAAVGDKLLQELRQGLQQFEVDLAKTEGQLH